MLIEMYRYCGAQACIINIKKKEREGEKRKKGGDIFLLDQCYDSVSIDI